MKKAFLLWLLAMVLTLGCVSCSSSSPAADIPAEQLLTAALSRFTEEQQHNPSLYGTALEPMDAGYMGYFYRGEYDLEIPETEKIDSYALCVPGGLYPFEIDILRAASDADIKDVKALLDARAEIKAGTRGEVNNYDTSWLTVLDSLEVYTTGRYVILLCTHDNAAARAEIKTLLNADWDAESDTLSAGTEAETEAARPARSMDGETITDFASSVDENLLGAEATLPESANTDMSLPQSALPVITLTNYSQNDYINLGGTCEKSAVIHIRGNGNDFVFRTDDGNWICEVGIASKGSTTLTVTQEEVGKRESEPITVTAKVRHDIDRSGNGVCQVAIGNDAQGHFYGQKEDWCGTNLLSEKQQEGLVSRIEDKVAFLDKYDCELIYLIVPNPIAVYPESAPYFWKKSEKDTTRTEQFENAAIQAGATVIDLYDVLSEHRNDEFKIFHKTDSHWTEYGAYWGYKTLLDYIHKTWNDAEAMPIDGNLEFYKKRIVGGDMMTHGGIENNLFHETATFVKWLTPAVSNPNVYLTLYDEPTNQMDFTPVQGRDTVKNRLVKDKKLPTAMIIRDSFSANCYGYLNNSFSEVYWQDMWDYNFDKNYIKETKPDYYIVLVAERNIENILG